MKIKRKKRYCVYVLECQDGTYYTGYTPDPEKRVKKHNAGKGAKYTRDRRPVRLVWQKEYKYLARALAKERRVKKLTRKQKQEMIKIYEKTNK